MGLSGINDKNHIVSGSWIAWIIHDSIRTILSIPFRPWPPLPSYCLLLLLLLQLIAVLRGHLAETLFWLQHDFDLWMQQKSRHIRYQAWCAQLCTIISNRATNINQLGTYVAPLTHLLLAMLHQHGQYRNLGQRYRYKSTWPVSESRSDISQPASAVSAL